VFETRPKGLGKKQMTVGRREKHPKELKNLSIQEMGRRYKRTNLKKSRGKEKKVNGQDFTLRLSGKNARG